jgi:chromosome segregation ATPase
MRAAALVTLALLALFACSRRPADDAASADLRARVDRLEREGAAERARLAEDLAAMRAEVDGLRASLDAADQRLAELSGQENATAPRPRKSAHAALRNSLHEMYDSSRRALDRLGSSLDRSLHRTRQDRPVQTEPAGTPAN